MPFPWPLKILAKLLLSRFPLNHAFWKRLGLFEHGAMQHFEYVHHVFLSHLTLNPSISRECVLELGPGESLYTAVLARAMGFHQSYLIDVEPYSTASLDGYKQFAHWLASEHLQVPDIQSCQTIQEVLERCHARYLTNGLHSLRQIPSESVDLLYSHAVLEHIRLRDFQATIHEFWRLLKPRSASTHVIDFRDHLSGTLQHLRFPPLLWEQEWMARSGFYTNRLRFHQMCDIFRQAGFTVNIISVETWETCPVPKKVLCPEFRWLQEDELLIWGSTIQLLKP